MAKLGPNKYTKKNEYNIKQPSVAIDPERFNGLLSEYGIRILHQKITLCPNFSGNVESNAHALDCPVCGGTNFVHFDDQEIWGLFSQNRLVENFFGQGFWDKGTALLTVPTHLEAEALHPIYMSYFDSITLIDFKERFYELINKSDGDIDLLKFKALEVNYLRTSSKVYQYLKDFVIDLNGNLKWISDNRPSYDLSTGIGEPFTISYLRLPQYRVVELLHEGRYSQFHFKQPNRTTVRYPQQVIIKKDFLVAKTSIMKSLQVSEVVGDNLVPPEE